MLLIYVPWNYYDATPSIIILNIHTIIDRYSTVSTVSRTNYVSTIIIIVSHYYTAVNRLIIRFFLFLYFLTIYVYLMCCFCVLMYPLYSHLLHIVISFFLCRYVLLSFFCLSFLLFFPHSSSFRILFYQAVGTLSFNFLLGVREMVFESNLRSFVVIIAMSCSIFCVLCWS